jgi:hypothetical protein
MTAATCQIDACNRPRYARGWCKRHYARWQRYGDAAFRPRRSFAPGRLMIWIRDRALLYSGDECLRWPFKSKDRHGYGCLQYEGRLTGAHRVVCELAHGKAPTGRHYAAHSCGNGHLGCVNPRHLRWATPTENHADTLIHGRRHSKLTLEQVQEIRALRGKIPHREIAAKFDISISNVASIYRGATWAWSA